MLIQTFWLIFFCFFPHLLFPSLYIPISSFYITILSWFDRKTTREKEKEETAPSWHLLTGSSLSLVAVTLNRHSHTDRLTHTHGYDPRTADEMREMRGVVLWSQRDSVACQWGGQTGRKGRTKLLGWTKLLRSLTECFNINGKFLKFSSLSINNVSINKFAVAFFSF